MVTKTLYNKSQLDDLTKDYNPEMFLGDINNHYTGTTIGLMAAAENNMPDILNIGGYTFKNMGKPYTAFDKTRSGIVHHIVMIDYQATEQLGNEYPIFQVGIRVWRTHSGKVKSEIIRDGYTYKTRFF